ncbi:cell division protein FtsA [Deltaproteobacteria bacterium TL4]
MPTRNKNNNIIVGLDIGTTKICAIAADANSRDVLNIVGVGTAKSEGLRKGVVVNIEKTVQAIKKAVEECELMCGQQIHSVYAGIAGHHIKGRNSHGMVTVYHNRTVSKEDIRRVIDASQVLIPNDREVLHILPQEFIVDDQDGVQNPLGMSGARLEVNVHIVTGSVTSAQNIIKCCNLAGLDVEDIVLEPLASSQAVLSSDEQEVGVVLVDIGGGTTDITIYTEGSIVHTAVLALGGNHLTHDIAIGLQTPLAEAEEIKHKYGIAMLGKLKLSSRTFKKMTSHLPEDILTQLKVIENKEFNKEEDFLTEVKTLIGVEQTNRFKTLLRKYATMDSLVEADEMIQVPSVGGRKARTIQKQVLVDIIEDRFREIFEFIAQEIEKSQYRNVVASGVVITGGTCIMPGADELAHEVLKLPVRVGFPENVSGLQELIYSPKYATSVGLVRYGLNNQSKVRFSGDETNLFHKVSRRMKDWLHEFF